MKIIVLLGVHGSGKGEQMKLLVRGGFVKDYISTGEAFVNLHNPNSRYHIYEKLVSPYEHLYAEGKYFPDEITMELVRSELTRLKDSGLKIIGMEGFPRDINQAKMLEKVVEEIGDISLQFIFLDLPDEIALKRLAGRSKDKHRATDAVDDKRIALYHQVTDPMIVYLREKQLVKDVDDRPPIAVVHQSVLKLI